MRRLRVTYLLWLQHHTVIAVKHRDHGPPPLGPSIELSLSSGYRYRVCVINTIPYTYLFGKVSDEALRSAGSIISFNVRSFVLDLSTGNLNR
jgi:hypothetical protein